MITPEQKKIIADTLAVIKSELVKGYKNGNRMLLTLKRPDDVTLITRTSPKHNNACRHKIIIEFYES